MKFITTYKSLFAWLMLVMYFISPLRVYQPYINYSINYEYISTVLCENKDKLEMKCDGKCQLNKSIKQNAEEESKKQSTIENIQVEEIPTEKPYYTTPQFYLLKETSYSSYSEKNYSNPLKHTTPPPKA